MASVSSSGGNKQYPKDALVIISMMKELGITDYEPRAVSQLLEFATRYVTCVLDDARAFANHSKKKAIDIDDIKLAVMMQLDRVFTSPPPRDLLLEVARTKNNIPLPIIKPHCGIRLPPDRYCFSNCNYKHKTLNSKKPSGKGSFTFTSNQGTTIKVGKIQPSSSVVKRPSNLTTVAQSIGSQQNPVIKFTTNSGAVVGGTQKVIVSKPKVQVVGGSGDMQVVSGAGLDEATLASLKRKREDESQED